MAPQKIMIMRHGEKPAKDGTTLGVNYAGDVDGTELSVRGWQRAGALARLFWPVAGTPPRPLAKPDKLYAAGPSTIDGSKRSKHTLAPLAALSGLSVNTNFGVDQEPALAAAISADTGVVLVAWEHKRIQRIVASLANGSAIAPFWAGGRFDVVLVLDAPQWNLTQAFQMLLAGDTSQDLAAVGQEEKDGE